jgi:hypothetical protein
MTHKELRIGASALIVRYGDRSVRRRTDGDVLLGRIRVANRAASPRAQAWIPVSLTFASWNRLVGWVQRIDGLRRAA